ncbi:hypothetical protein F4778DRAFT_717084 [Xylariomycetidae sp. FL2044]|nr:hypothetical protein F4778DRAFT_717084 [Xylariomycetidae sp. FL2044]
MSPLTKIQICITAIIGSVAANSGKMTYYNTGLGACGDTHTDSDPIVALVPGDYGGDANPNNSPQCGKKINIHYNGKTAVATVADKCPTCSDHAGWVHWR